MVVPYAAVSIPQDQVLLSGLAAHACLSLHIFQMALDGKEWVDVLDDFNLIESCGSRRV